MHNSYEKLDYSVSGRYAQIPEWILTADVSDAAVRLFGILALFNPCYPTIEQLGKRMRCGKDKVYSARKELKGIGALSWTTKRYGRTKSKCFYRRHTAQPSARDPQRPNRPEPTRMKADLEDKLSLESVTAESVARDVLEPDFPSGAVSHALAQAADRDVHDLAAYCRPICEEWMENNAEAVCQSCNSDTAIEGVYCIECARKQQEDARKCFCVGGGSIHVYDSVDERSYLIPCPRCKDEGPSVDSCESCEEGFIALTDEERASRSAATADYRYCPNCWDLD